jgi:hypothetical protein
MINIIPEAERLDLLMTIFQFVSIALGVMAIFMVVYMILSRWDEEITAFMARVAEFSRKGKKSK